MSVQGLPLHPLVVHFAIVFLLLVAGAQILAVILSRFRTWIGWGLPVGGVVAAITVKVTTMSGQDLIGEQGTPLAQAHQVWGERLELLAYALAVVTVLHWVVTSSWGRTRFGEQLPGWAGTAVGVLALLIAVAVIVVTTITGHSGATAVWS